MNWQADVLAVGDIDGDTFPDLAFLQYLPNPPMGSIAVQLYDAAHPRSFVRTLSFDFGRVDGGPQGLALGDFNDDHQLDLVFHTRVQPDGSNGERFMIFLGNGDGTFQAPRITQPGLPQVQQLKTFDFNADGHADILAVGSTGGFYILLGRGDGTFAAPVDYPTASGTSDAREAQIVDFDGDRIADIAVASSTSTVSLFKGNGDGTFQPYVRFATGRDRSDTVAAGDLNGDGKPDLVVGVLLAGSSHSDFTVLLNESPALPDLIVADVSAPASAAPGQLINIDYSVQNIAAAFAAGDWRDAIYLSTSGAIDGNAVRVGIIDHVGGLHGGAAYPASAVLPLPAVPPGAYHLVVRTDDRSALTEVDEQNNTSASVATVAVQDVPALFAGTPVSMMIQPGRSHYFRYDARPGLDLRFSADIDAPERVEFYERYGSLPTRNAFD